MIITDTHDDEFYTLVCKCRKLLKMVAFMCGKSNLYEIISINK